jgi:hypothetical protein
VRAADEGEPGLVRSRAVTAEALTLQKREEVVKSPILSKVVHHFNTFNSVATILIAALAAAAAIAQVWLSASTTLPTSQLQATTIVELRQEVIQRRESLSAEIRRLDVLIADLTRAEVALTGSPVQQRPLDSVWLTALKTVAVYVVVGCSAVASFPALLLDVVGLLFGYSFPLLKGMWGWSWTTVTVDWYWRRASAVGIVTGVLLIGLPAAITNIQADRAARRSGASQQKDDPIP